jgi:CD109 antigen
MSGISRSRLTDPWGHPLFVTFRSHSFFTDTVRIEAHATPDSAPQNRTIITPVTAVSDIVELHSLGPDGKRSTPDDFIYATFSRVRSLQSAQDTVAKRATHQTVHSGQTGDIAGTIADITGAVIPGAVVVATNQKTGMEYEEKSDNDGDYLLGPLPVGDYNVRFRAKGFNDLVYDQVNVLPHNTVALDAKLNVGGATQTIEVSAPALTLSTDSAMVTTQQISSLPLMKIAPGLVGGGGGGVMSTPRLRGYFPETLLWRPEVITAPDGTATIHFPAADSITTWRISAAASTLQGNNGAGTAEFRTFQPFFAAFDPPSVLTIGDSIALPITLRNYLDHPVTVRGSLTSAPWFRLDGPAASTTLVPSQASASPVFRFTALTPVIDAKQEFVAQADETGDRIARPVTVHPNGKETAVMAATILSPGDNTLAITLPADMLPLSSDTTLTLYPNLGAHLRDALAAMATYPHGCAEQILSTAWPSLLIQRYSATLPQKDETLQKQTHLNLQEAYENLLADQLPNGGFAYWNSDHNADLALTAYAIQFLTDARNFIAIDDGIISKAVAYLGQQQQPMSRSTAGLWVRVDRSRVPHPEDTRGNAMLTASIAAMIAGAPNSEPLLKNALAAIQPFANEFDEPYTLASYALAALALKDTARSEPALKRLRTMALSQNGGAYWALETNTPFYGWGRAGQVEATAQVLRAFLNSGVQAQDDLVTRGLLFLYHEQDRHSLWYSTQATARVLDVLSEITLHTPVLSAGSDAGNLTVQVDSQAAITVPLPPAMLDAGPIFIPLVPGMPAGSHQVKLNLPKNSQAATAQLVSNVYRAWPAVAPASSIANNEQLRMTVTFATTKPLPGKPIEVTAHIERIGFQGYGMMIAEIGLPPGADVDRASLESAVAASDYQLNQYEVMPDKVLIYLWPKAGGLTLHFQFTLRYAIDALTAPSSVYDYYNPDARFDVPPTAFKTH